jgi:hypothetical protein
MEDWLTWDREPWDGIEQTPPALIIQDDVSNRLPTVTLILHREFGCRSTPGNVLLQADHQRAASP